MAGAGLTSLRAVLFDVDFTLFRPGPELGPEGYRRRGEQFGLELDPGLYDAARAAALAELQRHPELEHDDTIWSLFTERIVCGMGGAGTRAAECARAIGRQWEEHYNFDLYEDVEPVFEVLRRHGLKLGLVSNGARNLEEFVAHHALDVDAFVGSRAHGKTKPHGTIFRVALDALAVAPAEAAMVGDSLEDDVEGAEAVGIRAFLLDRAGLHAGRPRRLTDLRELPAALGLGG
jgi:putative hydrolase of the HAD superfamily